MRLLSFDTSTSDLHACLADGERIIASAVLRSSTVDRQYAASQLIPTIEKLCKEAGWSKVQLDAVVIGIGPGSFTGTRVAVVTARTLAQALNLPLIDISIFESYAFQAQAEGKLPAAIILSAGRNHYFMAAFEPDRLLGYSCVIAPAYLSVEAMLEVLNDVPFRLVDRKAYDVLNALQVLQLNELPILNNIAVTQCQIAWHRLCLHRQANSGTESSEIDEKLDKATLLNAFPYEKIVPLYIQGASITLKKKVSTSAD